MAEPRTRDLDTMVSLIHAHAEGYVAESVSLLSLSHPLSLSPQPHPQSFPPILSFLSRQREAETKEKR